MLTPFEWQQKDIADIVDQWGNGLIASDPGAGKTLEAVEIAKRIGALTVLIVAPLSTEESWRETVIEQELASEMKVINARKAGTIAYGELVSGVPGVYFIGHARFRGLDWRTVNIDYVIMDELHMLTSFTAKAGAQAINSLKQAGARLGLSGTLTRNREENLYAAFRAIYPDMEPWKPTPAILKKLGLNPEATSIQARVKDPNTGKTRMAKIRELNPKRKYDWCELYLNMRRGVFAPFEFKGERVKGFAVSLAPAYVQHRKRERCCKWHPHGFATWEKPQVREVRLPLTPEQKRIYKKLDEEQAAWIGDNLLIGALPLTERMRKLQVCVATPTIVVDPDTLEEKVTFAEDAKSSKLDWVVEQLTSGVLMGEKALILSHSRQITEILAGRLNKKGIKAAAWNGGTKDSERRALVSEFSDGDLQVIVASASSMGTGTDGLQKVCSNMVWLSRTDDITLNEQSEARLDRIGAARGMILWVLLSEGTEESGIYSKQMARALELAATQRKKNG